MPTANASSDAQRTALAAKLRSDGVSFQDKSHNALTVPLGGNASFKESTTGNAISGSLSVPTGSELDASVSGKKSFTVEVNVVPTGNPEFNMLAGKGDHAFALRTRKGSLDFFIYAGGEWRSLYCEMPTDASSGWIGKKHQVAGIYDAENNMLRVYADGKMIGEKAVGTTEGVASSAYPLTIGACPDTGRSSEADFYECRVYSKALTATELASQNTASPTYAPDSKYVQLWLDFDNMAEGALIGDINADGKVDVLDIKLLQNYLLAKTKLTSAQYLAADVNADGAVDVFDLGMLKRIVRNQ